MNPVVSRFAATTGYRTSRLWRLFVASGPQDRPHGTPANLDNDALCHINPAVWNGGDSLHDIDSRRAAVHGHVAEVARLFIKDDPLPCREDELLDRAFDGEEL
jgi:hypothetical protein